MSIHTIDGPLVEPERVAGALDAFRSDDPDCRLLEVDEDPSVYETAHVPGAVGIDWRDELAADAGEVVDASAFASLLGRCGITDDTTVVLYGDRANWFATHAYWLFSYYGHEAVYLMDGGREYWLANDLPTSGKVPSYTTREYDAGRPDESIRAHYEEVRASLEDGADLVDVRSPAEYRGDVTAPAGLDGEDPDRAGHIPDAVNIPWGEAVEFDGRFKPEDELRELYADVIGDDGDTISYCRIGERASHTWFVLSELLGEDAMNYEGSYTEWASAPDAPVEGGD